LNSVLARAQRACCPEVAKLTLSADAAVHLESAILAMFQREWQLWGKGRPLKSIAIVDENPTEQYLYPEFVLFRELFRRSGIDAVITSPEQLQFRNGELWADNRAIDLVYNRLTDFLLSQPILRSLREAYLADAVVLTPHP